MLIRGDHSCIAKIGDPQSSLAEIACLSGTPSLRKRCPTLRRNDVKVLRKCANPNRLRNRALSPDCDLEKKEKCVHADCLIAPNYDECLVASLKRLLYSGNGRGERYVPRANACENLKDLLGLTELALTLTEHFRYLKAISFRHEHKGMYSCGKRDKQSCAADANAAQLGAPRKSENCTASRVSYTAVCTARAPQRAAELHALLSFCSSSLKKLAEGRKRNTGCKLWTTQTTRVQPCGGLGIVRRLAAFSEDLLPLACNRVLCANN